MTYFLIKTGYHGSSLILNLDKIKNGTDFLDLFLHHTITLYLYGGGYLYSCLELGAIMAFLHDIADVTICISKIFMETNYKFTKGLIFGINIIVWFYTRCFLYPLFLYQSSQFVPDMGVLTPIFYYLLICLFFLHFYWFYIFVSIFIKYIVERKLNSIRKSVRTA